MQPQFSPHQPYGVPTAEQPLAPTAHHPAGKAWALVGGGAAVLALVLALLAATGAFRSGPPHYTEAQAVAHVRSEALTSEVGDASDAQITRALHSLCDGISSGTMTVSQIMTAGSVRSGAEEKDGLMVVSTAVATYCPTYYGQVVAWQATH